MMDPKIKEVTQGMMTALLREGVDLGNVIKTAISLAEKKGLVVKKNMFTFGWQVQLPNGSTYFAADVSDMVKYVRGY